MQNVTLGFIGAGKMMSSLVGGLIADGYDPHKIWASDPSLERHREIKDKFSIHLGQDNVAVAKQAQVLIFAVKPQFLKGAALEVAAVVQEQEPLIISVAAGIREADLRRWLGGHSAIVRCMPNTPALIQSGATALYANPKVSAEQKNLAESILRAVGLTVWVSEENQLDVVTALSGSGPAYFFLVMEALEQAAMECGLTPETAHLLTVQTALGAARMVLESDESAAKLREHVTSPGGTTERALQVLQDEKVMAIFNRALKAATARASELAELFGQ